MTKNDDHALIVCPLSLQPFFTPVIASDGHTYELYYLLRYIISRSNMPFISPVTRKPMDRLLIRNRALEVAHPNSEGFHLPFSFETWQQFVQLSARCSFYFSEFIYPDEPPSKPSVSSTWHPYVAECLLLSPHTQLYSALRYLAPILTGIRNEEEMKTACELLKVCNAETIQWLCFDNMTTKWEKHLTNNNCQLLHEMFYKNGNVPVYMAETFILMSNAMANESTKMKLQLFWVEYFCVTGRKISDDKLLDMYGYFFENTAISPYNWIKLCG